MRVPLLAQPTGPFSKIKTLLAQMDDTKKCETVNQASHEQLKAETMGHGIGTLLSSKTT